MYEYGIFAQTTVMIMCTISKSYQRFAVLLDKYAAEGADVSFGELCSAVRVSPSDMGELLVRELGMGGDELVDLILSGSRDHQCKFHEVFNPKPFRPEVEDRV